MSGGIWPANSFAACQTCAMRASATANHWSSESGFTCTAIS
jgi:hypothetical protein